MKQTLFAAVVLIAIAAALPAPAGASGPYSITGTAVSEDHNLIRTEYTVQAGAHPLDRFKMTRLVKDVPASQLRGTGAVLAIGGGKAFGPYLDDQLAQFTGTTDKTLLVEPDFGHIDHFMTADHREFVERPIFEWARRVLD